MSHVVVFNASARSHKIPTTPVKYLTEVRDEACQKFGVNKEQFTLKYNNKPVSLSQQIRHVNLPQGARLELVQASRSPTVISVALSLPPSEKSARLMQKFASNTSLWELLRHFESGQGANYNFTQRGVPEMNGTGTGAGRLNYEMPVITVMPGHKEYGSFVDLQKTLSQLGFDSGSASLKLGFKNSGTPLEEAMTQISQYFKSTDPAPSGAHSESSAQASSIPDPGKAAPEAIKTVAGETIRSDEPDASPMDVDQDPIDAEPSMPSVDGPAHVPSTTSSAPLSPPPEPTPATQQPSSSTLPRNIQIFSAPTSSTPQAARHAFNEADYQPSVDQLRGLQASYKDRSKNTRLLSDKELEQQEAERQEKIAAMASKGGIIRVRLPDGAFVQFSVSKTDTAAAVYDFVTSCLEHKNEPFHLSYRDAKGQFVQMDRTSKLLFQDMKFSSNELLTFRWDDGASAAVRGVKPVLSKAWQQKAAPLKIEEPVVNEPAQASSSLKGQTLGEGKPKKEYSAAEKENKLKSLLNKSIFKKK
ncbi:hypothetical protein DPSP01_001334 [Paraphaeosphaeria sporulosa]|uniref:UBX domain-containing protein n=1 Tax=Paraphaeosphaeria sporulosa TaxID=1460663 RepID=A0A177BYT6_9PLEO|nr:uncharacterized protein CC84DRAFT_308863 [Paraphaeosphaeria sporulosa]OAG00533.1 hypothetical protein CC84DRAFT_308863 [Paraphaeosphaeria sporulosa]